MLTTRPYILALSALLLACSPALYIVNDIDRTYSIPSTYEDYKNCFGQIPIKFSSDVPYGAQPSQSYYTGKDDEDVRIDLRQVINSSLLHAGSYGRGHCNKRRIESVLIKDVIHEYRYVHDTGAMYASAELNADLVIKCKKSDDKITATIVGVGPEISGGFFGGANKLQQALAKTTTHAAYDLLFRVIEICDQPTEKDKDSWK